MDSDLERLEDLLIQRSLEGLNGSEQREMETLLEIFPHIDADAFDRAVAAVTVSTITVNEEMPAELFAGIQASGVEFVEARRQAPPVEPRQATHIETARRRRPAARSNNTLPWLLAAASAAFAVFSWWSLQSPNTSVTAQEQRLVLVDAGAPVLEWSATEDPAAAGASGDVVWDNNLQQGYMRFRLLATNNPEDFQYQLWIFDAERDERYPVDGGVFDIPAGTTEVIVPIRAAIPVRNPALFAITVEPPGGVVVSSRERIALVAEVAQA